MRGLRISFIRWVIFAILLFPLVIFIEFSITFNWFDDVISTHTAFTCMDIVICIFYGVYGWARRICIPKCISSHSICICIAWINCIFLWIVLASIACSWVLFNCHNFCFYLSIICVCICICVFIWITINICVSVSVIIGSVCILFRIRTIPISICPLFICPTDTIVVGSNSRCKLSWRIKSWSNWGLFIILSSLRLK